MGRCWAGPHPKWCVLPGAACLQLSTSNMCVTQCVPCSAPPPLRCCPPFAVAVMCMLKLTPGSPPPPEWVDC